MTNIEDLQQRLKAAERVCQIVGVTGADTITLRGKAKTQAYLDWAHAYGHLAEPVSAEEITVLAARRDEIREATLARLALPTA